MDSQGNERTPRPFPTGPCGDPCGSGMGQSRAEQPWGAHCSSAHQRSQSPRPPGFPVGFSHSCAPSAGPQPGAVPAPLPHRSRCSGTPSPYVSPRTSGTPSVWPSQPAEKEKWQFQPDRRCCRDCSKQGTPASRRDPHVPNKNFKTCSRE